MRYSLHWGAGFSSVILNLRDGKVLSYETDHDLIHNTFGGRCYYTSRSGLSGEGYTYLNPDWVVTDAYRTDVSYEQTRWNYPLRTPDGREYFVFIPLAGHRGVNREYPAVITDGTGELHIVAVDQVSSSLRKIIKWDVETVTHVFHVGDPNTLKLTPISVRVSVDSEVGRVPVWRFLHRYLNLEYFTVYPSSKTLKERCLSIFERDGRYYHVNRYHLIDRVWDSDPTLSEMVDGWYRHGEMYYRRRYNSDTIQVFWEAPRGTLGEKYAHPTLPAMVDFEMEVPLLDWVAKPLQEWETDIKRSALKKAIQDLRWVLEGDYNRCASLLEEADESILLTRADSLAVGNCSIGTDRFITEYNLPLEGITIGELREHPRLQEMLKVWDFRKVLVRVIDPATAVHEEVRYE